uniref:sulfurtransferase n=1 Tax=Paenibacillus terrae TaxID=159743 RepID=UPI0011A6D833|nr:sulfurtransferase [Paenibacillus terrae]
MSVLVNKAWVLARMYEPDVTIVDCRFMLGQPDAGSISYEESHIPGAVFLDLEKDLSSSVSEHGGRHPLPDTGQLAAKLGKVGINRETRVIAYDDQGGLYASRLWWLLSYMGHETVFVMNEGFSAWKDAGYPVSKDQPVRVPTTFTADVHPEMLVNLEDVRQAMKDPSIVILDSRESSRYLGLNETIDHTAGHIPGAKNKFWKGVLQDNGEWKSLDELKEYYKDVPKDHEIIVYCGSGVSACPNVLALTELGYPDVRLYAGSWSDWISYSENPIATGEE